MPAEFSRFSITMSLIISGRVWLALCWLAVVAGDGYSVPDPTVQTFKPKGLRFTIPDATNVALFAIQGILKHGDKNIEFGGETATASGDKWVVDLPDIQLAVGDNIDYLAFVAINNEGYIKDNLHKTVTELTDIVPLDKSSTVPVRPCKPTVTRVRHGSVCKGEIIFEENFDFLQHDIWQVQQYVPVQHPELPFVSYKPSPVSVTKEGYLRIAPVLQQTLPGFTSMYKDLDLRRGCTAEDDEACFAYTSEGSIIIPPVVSGRIVSKPGFAFTYGKVTIRAKLPHGDWIYPEILLEPLMKTFSYNTVNSGMLKIASARGNKDLKKGSTQYGNKVLYSGPVVNTVCHDDLLVNKTSNKSWSDDFHVYSVVWAEDNFTMYVDGQEYARMEKGFRGRLPEICRSTPDPGMEPFNDFFYITLGVAVGGHSEFPDDSTTEGNHAKPWKNRGSKATINFWKDQAAWNATWNHPELLIDYVKVEAL